MYDLPQVSPVGVSEPVVAPVLSENTATATLIAELRKIGARLTFTQDEVPFVKGEPAASVYLVLSGEVELTLPISRLHALGFRASVGSLVGLPAVFSNHPYSLTAIVREGSELVRIDRLAFCGLLAANPFFAFDVLRILAAETRAARISIIDVSARHRRRGLPRRPGRAPRLPARPYSM